MNKLILGSIILLGAALAVVAVSGAKGNARTLASHRRPGNHVTAPGPAQHGAGFAAPDHFLSGRAELPL